MVFTTVPLTLWPLCAGGIVETGNAVRGCKEGRGRGVAWGGMGAGWYGAAGAREAAGAGGGEGVDTAAGW